MSGTLYVEGGGKGKDLEIRCKRGFRELLEKCKLPSRPRVMPCGARDRTFKAFEKAVANQPPGYVAMWIDSEDPVRDTNKPWDHLAWKRPKNASDDQVLLMTTCMETLIAADPSSAQKHFGKDFHAKSLPSTTSLETRSPESLFIALRNATKSCSKQYDKGATSFAVLADLDPDTLAAHLPSFKRTRDILRAKL